MIIIIDVESNFMKPTTNLKEEKKGICLLKLKYGIKVHHFSKLEERINRPVK